jgi:hypothetical protein
MSVASVTALEPARGRRARKAEMKAARKQARLDEALRNAKTSGQVAAVAFDELRIALAKVAETDPNGAMTWAWEIHNDLRTRAHHIATGSGSPMSSLAPHNPREGSY